jgi:hypothetical protein
MLIVVILGFNSETEFFPGTAFKHHAETQSQEALRRTRI